MRVGYLFDGYLRTSEGVPAYIDSLAGYMGGQGHEVAYLVGGSDRTGPSIIELGRTATFGTNGNRVEQAPWVSAKRAQQVLDLAEPDVLHLQMPHNPFASGRVVKRAVVDVPVVATFHVLPNSAGISIAMRAMARVTGKFNRSLGAMISNSEATQQFLRDIYRIDSEHIPCPVEVGRFQAGKRLEHYNDDKTNVVFLGRLVERKGAQHLINAVGNLDDNTRKRLRVLIAGTGELEPALRGQVARLALSEHVEFLGYVAEVDKPDLLATADLAVFPATGGESFGIVLAEAMASGSGLVIGGNNPGYSSVLSDTPEAIVDPRNIGAFSNTLRRFIMNEEERQRLHEAQQQKVMQFDTNRVGARIEEIYRDLVAS
jgi:phosphatidylinositol alpha-mannosyltransferase